MADANTQLMTRIRAAWGDAIVLACARSSVPPSFVAALIANESGGDAGAHRFEKGVLDSLWEVLLGRASNYGSLKRDELLCFLCPPPKPILPGTNISISASTVGGVPPLPASMQRLDSLATSHGLTQVMGYEAIALHLDGVARLADPAGELPITLRMLADFAHRFGLDLTASSSTAAGELFDCWNSGRPHAPTADPQYIPKGLARMKIYAELSAATAESAT
jgi:hypothetical protein